METVAALRVCFNHICELLHFHGNKQGYHSYSVLTTVLFNDLVSNYLFISDKPAVKYVKYVLQIVQATLSFIVQEPKEKRRGSLSFNSRVWQPCGSKNTFMFL